MTLSFELPPGAYATLVLKRLCGRAPRDGQGKPKGGKGKSGRKAARRGKRKGKGGKSKGYKNKRARGSRR